MLATEVNTTAKLDAMKLMVAFLQTTIEQDKESRFASRRALCAYIQSPIVKAAVGEYLSSQTIQSKLSRIAFPSANHADVALALQAGSTLDALYRLACGTPFYVDGVWIPPHLLRDQTGRPLRAKHGLKIIWRSADIPKNMKNALLARYRRPPQAAGFQPVYPASPHPVA